MARAAPSFKDYQLRERPPGRFSGNRRAKVISEPTPLIINQIDPTPKLIDNQKISKTPLSEISKDNYSHFILPTFLMI
jgi:hypothetical protein